MYNTTRNVDETSLPLSLFNPLRHDRLHRDPPFSVFNHFNEFLDVKYRVEFLVHE